MPQAHPSPIPLRLGACLAGLEGVGLLVLAVLELAHVGSGHAALSVSLAVFFALYAALLVAGAVALFRGVPWPRGPVLISQLILLGLAWGLRDQPLEAVAAAVVAVATIAGLVHPASVEALEAARGRGHSAESDSSD